MLMKTLGYSPDSHNNEVYKANYTVTFLQYLRFNFNDSLTQIYWYDKNTAFKSGKDFSMVV